MEEKRKITINQAKKMLKDLPFWILKRRIKRWKEEGYIEDNNDSK